MIRPMFESIRDWLARRRETGRASGQPTGPPEPELTPEEEAVSREQRAGEPPEDEPRLDEPA
jgi:hypothetical protein